MTALNEMTEDIRPRGKRIKASELKARMAEIEKELNEIAIQSKASQAEVRQLKTKQDNLTQTMATIGKVCFIVVSVIVALQLATGSIPFVVGQ